jgi:hypothetical protein
MEFGSQQRNSRKAIQGVRPCLVQGLRHCTAEALRALSKEFFIKEYSDLGELCASVVNASSQ